MASETAILEYFLAKWRSATEQGDHHKALIFALTAYLILKEVEPGIEGVFLLKVELSAGALQGKSREELMGKIRTETVCSFCGRGPEDVELVAGGGVNICENCTTKFHEFFLQRS